MRLPKCVECIDLSLLLAEGDKLDSHYHQVVGLEEGEKDGLVVRCDKSGWKFSENNDVIR